MRHIAHEVAQRLNEMHNKQNEKINEDRDELPPFQSGDLVYYRLPVCSGSKLDSRWLGPARIIQRDCERSYTKEIREGSLLKRITHFLKHVSTTRS